jgi:hypothetical protein
MDIHTLKIYATDTELQELAQKLLPPDAPVKNFAIKASPDGVRVSGEIATPMLPVPFESLWQPAVEGGRVVARLAALSAAGFPATPLRALVLDILKSQVKEPFIEVQDEAVVVDVQDLVKRQNLPVALRFEVRAVRCLEGGIEAEAGLPETGSVG